MFELRKLKREISLLGTEMANDVGVETDVSSAATYLIARRDCLERKPQTKEVRRKLNAIRLMLGALLETNA